jgi:hypothetical protein
MSRSTNKTATYILGELLNEPFSQEDPYKPRLSAILGYVCLFRLNEKTLESFAKGYVDQYGNSNKVDANAFAPLRAYKDYIWPSKQKLLRDLNIIINSYIGEIGNNANGEKIRKKIFKIKFGSFGFDPCPTNYGSLFVSDNLDGLKKYLAHGAMRLAPNETKKNKGKYRESNIGLDIEKAIDPNTGYVIPQNIMYIYNTLLFPPDFVGGAKRKSTASKSTARKKLKIKTKRG